jgi:hypothetical protein
VNRSAADIVVRIRDDQRGFEPGKRAEIFRSTDDQPGRTVQTVPHGPYRIIKCEQVTVLGAPRLDVTLRKIRRA